MEVEVGSKRKSPEGGGQSKKMRKSYDITGKTPIIVLHNVFEGVEFTYVEVDVKPHTFKVSAKIDGIEFQGIGVSKALARRDLALKALHDLKGITPLDEGKDTFPCNDGQFFCGFENVLSQETPEGARNPFSEQPTEIVNIPMIDIARAKRDPVQALNLTWPNADVTWSQVTKGDFRAELMLIGRKFYGEGRSKKVAKLNLAKAIFLNIYNIKDFECRAEAAMDVDESQEKQKKKKKFPTAQLKDLVGESGEEMTEEIVEIFEGDEKKFHATIVVRGTAYEAVATSKAGARLVATKKALELLKPKDAAPKALNRQGVDISLYPTEVFKEHFPDVDFTETESMSADGRPEHHIEVKINRRSFKVTASSKKKAKLRLILQIFETMKKTSRREWKSIDVNKVFEDKPVNS